ncbi:AaceriADL007Cp [[Ashbya] aceris (nom. inval.)]|nr:AaceriADL007Cp [[Ashbya] aceris (nom. inval.)]
MSSRFDQNTAHQRTQLFGPNYGKPVKRSSSPFNSPSIDYSQSTLAQLESQSDADVGVMREKIMALKTLSERMGEEIRGSSMTLDSLGSTFDATANKLKRTYNKMMVVAGKSRISLKVWLGIFLGFGILFFYVWVR